ncbi:eukaryotic translation initiation factor 4E transporter isoform X3 [Frankliniella occidentalis]|uniref:Eukaryotic translation initiation factor 4E transporter isoform X3 n=1 Tax=Frankliniella occidentalis TaxID=133901 RepID=A0A6J1T5D8_FRAOC|nr:eukaryotic translation initiation factor 4E transporter isoform X3 [Frankliniella occidentalis]
MEGAGPIRVRRSRARKRPRGPAGGPLQGKTTQNGGMRWFRSRSGRKRSGNEAEETIAMSEGGLSGDDKDDDEHPRHAPDLKYTRGRLMELRSHPLANKRPACLDNPNNEAIAGHGDRKRSETPTEEDSRRRGDSTGNAEKRRSNDPRERVKKEQDGIVLSPQRRSFNSGCYVPPSQSAGAGRRPESPIGKPESNLILGRDIGHRELPTARRIGSGRIPARDAPWEFREPSWEMREAVWDQLDGTLAPEHGSFRPGGGTGSGPLSRGADSDRNHRDRDADLRHENRRRGFGWDFPRERDRDGERDRDRERDRDLDKDRFDRRADKGRNERHERVDDRMTDRLMRRPDREDRDGRDDRGRRDDRDRRDDMRDNRYGRRRHDSREEEPEWFSAGPTSQHDTIELRGFEDIPEDGQVTGRGKKNTRAKANSRLAPGGRKISDSSISSGRTASTPPPQETSKKASPDGKGDKSRAGGPLATSSPDTKEKRAKQNRTLAEAANDSKEHKERMDISEDSSARVENGRADIAEKAGNSTNSAHIDFNLDDFLKIDSLPLLNLNGGQAEATAGGSRFRQWFSRNSPTNDDSMRTVPDDLTNITEPTISIPSGNELDSFFAPISPAASSLHQKQQLQLHLQQQQLQAKLSQQNAPNKLLEMLRRGSDAQTHPAPGEIPSIRDLEVSGKIHSVEELEARMRPKPEGGAMPPVREPRLADPAIASVVHHGGLQQHMQHKEDEVAALKKLIMKRNMEPQVASEAPVNASNNAIMGAFPGMPQTAIGSMGPAGHGGQHHSQSQSSQPYNIPEELLMKLLQVQQQQQQQQHPHQQQQQQQQQQQHQLQQQQRQHPQDMLSKLMNNARMSQQQMHQSHQMHQQANRRQGQMLQSDHFNSVQPNRSPLPPDVQTLIANTPLNHDLLQRAEAQAILRGLAQREITTQNLVQQLQNPAITRRHQELLLSILKTQSGQRVPSPRDMNPQAQHLMQSALIKKKLEEQREQALRKRQETHRSISPNVGNFNNSSMNKDVKHPMSSPTPLAFTPTSVLKKMNAEKDGDQKIGGMSLSDLQQMQQGPRQQNMQLSASQVQQHQQHRLPPNWNQNKSQAQPQGRPILKSNNNFYSGNDSFPSQPSGGSQNHLQQMQGMPAYLRGPPPPQPQYNTRSKMTLSTPPPNMAQQTQQYNMNIMQARPGMPQSSNQRGQHMQSMHGGMQNQQHNTSPLQQMLMGAHFSNQKSAMSHGGSGDVSSNTNQLSRWFSPEVLAQSARSGPSIPAQGMLSVEEIERLQQAVPN